MLFFYSPDDAILQLLVDFTKSSLRVAEPSDLCPPRCRAQVYPTVQSLRDAEEKPGRWLAAALWTACFSFSACLLLLLTVGGAPLNCPPVTSLENVYVTYISRSVNSWRMGGVLSDRHCFMNKQPQELLQDGNAKLNIFKPSPNRSWVLSKHRMSWGPDGGVGWRGPQGIVLGGCYLYYKKIFFLLFGKNQTNSIMSHSLPMNVQNDDDRRKFY